MPESTIQPAEIYIDKIYSGRARLLCRWNISSVTREFEGTTQTIYTYDEAALWWTFPYLAADGATVLDNYAAIEAYLIANKADILNYAKGTKISLVGEKKKLKINNETNKGNAHGHDKEPEYTIKGNK